MIQIMLASGREFILMFNLKIGFVKLPFELKKARWQNQWGRGLEIDINTPVIALGLAFEVMALVKRKDDV
jgi:hypothetical protein